MKTLRLLLAFTVVCGLGCKSTKITSEHDLDSPPANRPALVYVADFELAARDIKHEEGLLSRRPGPVGRIGDRLGGSSDDPAARARQIVDLMSNSLVKEISKSGFSARRLQPGISIPSGGWLVRGIFTEVQEGNRLRRAMIGFGRGQTDLQVVTTFNDLSQGPPRPFYEVATDATSGSAPGAAPTLVLSPYGAAVRFVMAGKDLDKNVKQTAARIAKQITQRIQSAD